VPRLNIDICFGFDCGAIASVDQERGQARLPNPELILDLTAPGG
jgi:hypothetical protein